ncbi:hypothetical protein SAMN05444156_2457 [Verrucomicrobium sp. GAS474]|nr:hypothetical protein SAMN05444156_2457 [Verrucomicrobium sp. GAS474]
MAARLPFFNHCSFQKIRRSIGHLSGTGDWWRVDSFDLEELSGALGLVPEESKEMFVEHLLGDEARVARTFVHVRPRQCPVCRESGYHSVLFQLSFTARCPIHGVPLENSGQPASQHFRREREIGATRPPRNSQVPLPKRLQLSSTEWSRMAEAFEWVRGLFVHEELPSRTLEVMGGDGRLLRSWVVTTGLPVPSWVDIDPHERNDILDLEIAEGTEEVRRPSKKLLKKATSIYKAIARRIWRRELSKAERVGCLKVAAEYDNNIAGQEAHWWGGEITPLMAAFLSWRTTWEETKPRWLFDQRFEWERQESPRARLHLILGRRINGWDYFSCTLRDPASMNGRSIRLGDGDRLRLMGRVCLESFRRALASASAEPDPNYFHPEGAIGQPIVSVRFSLLVTPKRTIP